MKFNIYLHSFSRRWRSWWRRHSPRLPGATPPASAMCREEIVGPAPAMQEEAIGITPLSKLNVKGITNF